MLALNKVFQQKERLFHATFIKRRGIIQKQNIKNRHFFEKQVLMQEYSTQQQHYHNASTNHLFTYILSKQIPNRRKSQPQSYYNKFIEFSITF